MYLDVKSSPLNGVLENSRGAIKSKNCCEMETPAKKRRIVNTRTNWTKLETDQFLQLVINLKDKFEKPTARIFYSQLAAMEPVLSSFNWMGMRDKMKNLRKKYKSAIAWRNNTGAALDAEDKERTIRDHILKLCPQFDLLEQLFSEQPSVRPLLVFFDSDDTASTEPDEWVDPSLEMVLSLGEDEGIAGGDTSPASPLLTSPGASQPLQDQHAALGRPSFPPDSFSAFKQEMVEKVPSVAQVPKPTSSLAHLSQINIDPFGFRLEAIKYKADKKAEIEDKRLQLEREKFQWQQKRERKLLELDEKRMLVETRLKIQKLNNKFILEKFRIEKEFELKKIERE